MRSRVVWILSGAGGDSFLGGGPSCWRELSDIPVRRLGESREHILEVRERIKPATTATLNQCVNHRTPMPSMRLANKQPVFLATAVGRIARSHGLSAQLRRLEWNKRSKRLILSNRF